MLNVRTELMRYGKSQFWLLVPGLVLVIGALQGLNSRRPSG